SDAEASAISAVSEMGNISFVEHPPPRKEIEEIGQFGAASFAEFRGGRELGNVMRIQVEEKDLLDVEFRSESEFAEETVLLFRGARNQVVDDHGRLEPL